MEKNYTYEVTENGYYILINGEKVVHQYEPFIPDKTKSYEENAQAQIAEMQENDAKSVTEQATIESLKEELNITQEAVASLTEMLLNKEA